MEHGNTRVIIRAARLFDSRAAQTCTAQAVVVQAGRIIEVCPWSADLPTDDAQLLDLGDVTLLPGLIDADAHLTLDPGAKDMGAQVAGAETLLLRAVGNAEAALRAGVTTVCDAGGPNPIVFAVRGAIRDGVLAGPRACQWLCHHHAERTWYPPGVRAGRSGIVPSSAVPGPLCQQRR